MWSEDPYGGGDTIEKPPEACRGQIKPRAKSSSVLHHRAPPTFCNNVEDFV